MTNTYMLAGERDPAEILASVKNGIYAVSFGGGQVDITSGKYVFQCTEAYRIENGKLGAPLKGAMLIGNGPTDLNRITMIGNDLALDTGIGTCGKNGQGVPVGVGQPTLRMERITVMHCRYAGGSPAKGKSTPPALTARHGARVASLWAFSCSQVMLLARSRSKTVQAAFEFDLRRCDRQFGVAKVVPQVADRASRSDGLRRRSRKVSGCS